MLKHIIPFILLITFSISVYASHLIGGNLGYEYIGKFGSLYRYKVILTTYTNCDATSLIPLPEGPTLAIGVYEQDIQNDPMGGGAKNWIMNVDVQLVDSNHVNPNLPGNCPIGSNVCIYKGVYEGYVDLPVSFNGYHLYYERCCRNGSIVNLVPSESMAFHAYIPSPLLPNSSPVFTDDPVPFLCAGDTTTILNTAYDADGDLLVFSFVTPYNGFANINNPAPMPPQPTLGWTIPTVSYAGGYSTALPFGAGGYTSINASTGLTKYYPPVTGDYVVAVEIKEYRNGNLIGVTRRDLQLLVLNCSPNSTPSISPVLGSVATQYTVTEGETLCFNFGYDDPEGDSVRLEVNGQIFDPNFVNPPATVISPVSGLDTVSTSFCWTTVCGQAQSLPYQFQVSATDNGCPPKSTNNVFQITVDPVSPPDTIFGPLIVCENSSQTYSTQNIANTTYNWTVTGGTITANNGSSVTVLWGSMGTGTVSVSATNQYGCNSAPVSIQVTKTGGPSVNAGTDVTICIGDSVQLNASVTAVNAYTVSWTPATNILNASTEQPTVFPTTTTDYVITVNMGGGMCVNRDTVQVTVNLPQINAGTDDTICKGDSVQLNATGATSYLWETSPFLSDVTISNPYAYPQTTQSFVVSGADANGCSGKDTVQVVVNNLPVANAGQDTWVCPGGSTTLNGSGGISYLWSPSSFLSANNIANPVVSGITNDVNYVLEVTDTNGCKNTDTVLVFASLNVPTDAGLDTTICFGDTVQIGGNPTAVNGTSFAWVPNAVILDSTVSNPFVYPTVTTDFIVYTSNDTCTGVDTVRVIVNPLPNVYAGADTSLCINDTIQLTASGATVYAWSPNQNISDTTVFNPFVFPLQTQTYFVEGTGVNGCRNTDTIIVTVNPLPQADAGVDTLICYGDSFQLNASGGVDYVWLPDNALSDDSIANPYALPLTTTDYSVKVTDTNGCVNYDTMQVEVYPLPNVYAGEDTTICVNDTVQLTAVGASIYTWSTSISLSDSTIYNPLAYPTVTTTYIVVGTYNHNCKNSDTVTVNVQQSPQITTSGNTAICIGDTVQISASGGVEYAWTPNVSISDTSISNPFVYPTSTITYLVEGKDTLSCGSVAQVTVVVNAKPNVVANPVDLINICKNDTTQLQASGAVSYTWTPTQGLNFSNISNPLAYPNSTTDYVVEGTDANGCTNMDTVRVAVFEVFTIPDTAICKGDGVTLDVTGAPGNSYTWTPASGLDNPNSANPVATPDNTTTYVVSVTDVAGCQDQAQVTITVLSAPHANISTDVSANCDGTTVAFTNTTPANENVWIFSDGTSTQEENPVHEFGFDGSYTAILITTDASGCKDTAYVSGNTLNFDDLFVTMPPNVFTPNGDGENDYFELTLNPLVAECSSIVIFNRWGQKVFESDNADVKWDGKTKKGKKVPSGTYYYIIDLNGIVYKGTLMIMR